MVAFLTAAADAVAVTAVVTAVVVTTAAVAAESVTQYDLNRIVLGRHRR